MHACMHVYTLFFRGEITSFGYPTLKKSDALTQTNITSFVRRGFSDAHAFIYNWRKRANSIETE